MKRSLDNQLLTQATYASLLNNIFFMPLFAWRVMLGPLNPILSLFGAIIDNVYKTWIGLCFTQIAVFKVENILFLEFLIIFMN